MAIDFVPFDPLAARQDSSEAAARAARRDIKNILSSYTGWYDPFCELIQNSLDALDARQKNETEAGNRNYRQELSIIIDVDANQLTVSDNGCGMTEAEFRQFLTPSFSFKDEDVDRGHKGVGATYLAYGFNLFRIHTRTPQGEISGRISHAREWLTSPVGSEAPKMEKDSSPDVDPWFRAVDRGTTATVSFSPGTQPAQLSWLKAKSAATWLTILRVKTGIGSVKPDLSKKVTVTCIVDGEATTETLDGTSYFWLHEAAGKSARIGDIRAQMLKTVEQYGSLDRLPPKYKDLSFIYEEYGPDDFRGLLSASEYSEHLPVIEEHQPRVYVEYGYSTRLWKKFNEDLGIRANNQVVRSGIQLAANRMPQGDTIPVPLVRYTGRQNQVHVLIHFENYTPDVGRKIFTKTLADFAQDVSRAIIQGPVAKLRASMKKDSGFAPNLSREMKVDAWKQEMIKHEQSSPLEILSEHFFAPRRKAAITSIPTREQDVIALFHEFLSGGVIRGMNIMSTNERLTYDGLYRVNMTDPKELLVYDEERNPLGVTEEVFEGVTGQISQPRVLEYKYSLDGLVNDLSAQEKNINDIDLCVAWTLGEEWQEHFGILTLLVDENRDSREYHGLTHVLVDPDSRAPFCGLVILEDLIDYLNDSAATQKKQRQLFEE